MGLRLLQCKAIGLLRQLIGLHQILSSQFAARQPAKRLNRFGRNAFRCAIGTDQLRRARKIALSQRLPDVDHEIRRGDCERC